MGGVLIAAQPGKLLLPFGRPISDLINRVNLVFGVSRGRESPNEGEEGWRSWPAAGADVIKSGSGLRGVTTCCCQKA
jgi:hypothetical protein